MEFLNDLFLVVSESARPVVVVQFTGKLESRSARSAVESVVVARYQTEDKN